MEMASLDAVELSLYDNPELSGTFPSTLGTGALRRLSVASTALSGPRRPRIQNYPDLYGLPPSTSLPARPRAPHLPPTHSPP